MKPAIILACTLTFSLGLAAHAEQPAEEQASKAAELFEKTGQKDGASATQALSNAGDPSAQPPTVFESAPAKGQNPPSPPGGPNKPPKSWRQRLADLKDRAMENLLLGGASFGTMLFVGRIEEMIVGHSPIAAFFLGPAIVASLVAWFSCKSRSLGKKGLFSALAGITGAFTFLVGMYAGVAALLGLSKLVGPAALSTLGDGVLALLFLFVAIGSIIVPAALMGLIRFIGKRIS